MGCLTLEQLLAYMTRSCSPSEAESVNTHLDRGCPVCRKQARQIRQLTEAINNDRLMGPPDWLLCQAGHLIGSQLRDSLRSGLTRVPAILLVDSFATGLLTGVRGGGVSSRQLLYRAGKYDIDLSIDYLEASRLVDLIGQAMPHKVGGHRLDAAEAVLSSHSGRTYSTVTNRFGEFIFSKIPHGIYDLQIVAGHEELDVCGIQAISRTH